MTKARRPEERTAQAIVKEAKTVLGLTQRGLHDIQSGDPNLLVSGLYNVAAFGHSVIDGTP